MKAIRLVLMGLLFCVLTPQAFAVSQSQCSMMGGSWNRSAGTCGATSSQQQQTNQALAAAQQCAAQGGSLSSNGVCYQTSTPGLSQPTNSVGTTAGSVTNPTTTGVVTPGPAAGTVATSPVNTTPTGPTVAQNNTAASGACGAFRSDIADIQTQVRQANDDRISSGLNVIRQASQTFNNVCMSNLSAINTTQFGPAGSRLMTAAAQQLCKTAIGAATKQVNQQTGKVMNQYGQWTDKLGNLTSSASNYVDRFGNIVDQYGNVATSAASGAAFDNSGNLTSAFTQTLSSAIGNNSQALGGLIAGNNQNGSQLGSLINGQATNIATLIGNGSSTVLGNQPISTTPPWNGGGATTGDPSPTIIQRFQCSVLGTCNQQ